jgi:uncharacterized repeat protein (TIGR03803 family)
MKLNSDSRNGRVVPHLGALALLVVIGAFVVPARAQTFTILHTFTGGSDGGTPLAPLTFFLGDTLFGTASVGGGIGSGTVFALTRSGKETDVYSFCSVSECVDGASPLGSVIGHADALFGTTTGGGALGQGAIYAISGINTENVIYSFQGGADGYAPLAGLTADRSGNLYGTTYLGGKFGVGTVFRVTTKSKKTTLHSFGSGNDGAEPSAGGSLILDSSGNLYGTTEYGGEQFGTVYKVDAHGNETVLHRFGVTDGAYPIGALVMDTEGNLYGTTSGGGSHLLGTIFKLDPQGKETILHSFAGSDGVAPAAGLVMDAKGDLFGTTSMGGSVGVGTVFKLNTQGRQTVLYNFTGGTDGSTPMAALLLDTAGSLYGTASSGGANNYGTVFKIVP